VVDRLFRGCCDLKRKGLWPLGDGAMSGMRRSWWSRAGKRWIAGEVEDESVGWD
jgi:hypothetical protein